MNERHILEMIKEKLERQAGEKTGGSGHLSQVTISNIKIDDVEEFTQEGEKHLRVMFSYTVDIQSEFTYAEESDPNRHSDILNPYHYRKTEKIVIPVNSN